MAKDGDEWVEFEDRYPETGRQVKVWYEDTDGIEEVADAVYLGKGEWEMDIFYPEINEFIRWKYAS